MSHLAIALVLLGAQLYRAPTGEFPTANGIQDVWVHFTDKGFQAQDAADRVLARLQKPLDERAMVRRLRAMGSAFDFDDLPPYERYVSEVQELGGELRVRSAWLNAASFRMPAELLPTIARLPFVYRVTALNRKWEPTGETYFTLPEFHGGGAQSKQDTLSEKEFYRLAYDQNRQLGVPPVYAMGITGSGVRLGLLDTGLKRRHRAVIGLRVVGEHDFLSGDRFLTASADNLSAPESIPSLQGLGIAQESKVLQTPGFTYLCFVADTARYGAPLRGIFASVSSDDGASWGSPQALYFDYTYSSVHYPAVAGADSFAYVGWQSALRSEQNAQVWVGYFRNGIWQGAQRVLSEARMPNLFVRQGQLYMATVTADSALLLSIASIAGGLPAWGANQRIAQFGEIVKNPAVVVDDANEILVTTCGWRTGRIYLFRSIDGGATFEELASPAPAGASQPQFSLNGGWLSLVYKDYNASPFAGLTYQSSADAVNWARAAVVDSLLGIGSFDLRTGTELDIAYENEGRIYVRNSTDNGVTWFLRDSMGTTDFSFQPRWVGPARAIWVENGDGNTDVEPGDSLRFGTNQADHGTRMASIIAGFQERSMVGVAPGVEFLIAKNEFHSFRLPTVGYEFSVEEDNYIEALEWAERRGADIISSSLGYTGWYESKDFDGKTAPISIAAGRAAERGMVVVTAMGNRDSTEAQNRWPNPYIVTPGDAFNVITAGGIEKDSSPWHTPGGSGTGCGPTADGRHKPDLVALGDSVTVVAPDSANALEGSSGTSCATALIAGCVALIMEAHPDWTAQGVRDTMLKYAWRPAAVESTWRDTFGWGIPNVKTILDKYPPKPERFTGDRIGNVFPNPFAAGSKVYFPLLLTRPATILSISIFSLDGELVRKIEKPDLKVEYFKAPGRYEDRSLLDQAGAFWDGKNSQGKLAASGLYYAVLKTGFGRGVTRFAVVR